MTPKSEATHEPRGEDSISYSDWEGQTPLGIPMIDLDHAHEPLTRAIEKLHGGCAIRGDAGGEDAERRAIIGIQG